MRSPESDAAYDEEPAVEAAEPAVESEGEPVEVSYEGPRELRDAYDQAIRELKEERAARKAAEAERQEVEAQRDLLTERLAMFPDLADAAAEAKRAEHLERALLEMRAEQAQERRERALLAVFDDAGLPAGLRAHVADLIGDEPSMQLVEEDPAQVVAGVQEWMTANQIVAEGTLERQAETFQRLQALKQSEELRAAALPVGVRKVKYDEVRDAPTEVRVDLWRRGQLEFSPAVEQAVLGQRDATDNIWGFGEGRGRAGAR